MSARCAAAAFVFSALLAPECLAFEVLSQDEVCTDASSSQGSSSTSGGTRCLLQRSTKFGSTHVPGTKKNVSSQVEDGIDKQVVWITTFFNSNITKDRDPHICAVAQNILNPQIGQVVLLTEDATVRKDQFSKLPHGCTTEDMAPHLRKLEILLMDNQPTYYDFFQVANTRFSGKMVVIANGDVYLGSKIPSTWTPTAFDKRILVSLSIRPSPICEKLGYKPQAKDQCDEYIGAHDAHIFVPAIADAAMQTMHQKMCQSCPQNYSWNPNRWGAENLLLDVLRKEGGLRLFNPCKDILLMHLHCENVHTAPLERLNNDRTAMITPTGADPLATFIAEAGHQ